MQLCLGAVPQRYRGKAFAVCDQQAAYWHRTLHTHATHTCSHTHTHTDSCESGAVFQFAVLWVWKKNHTIHVMMTSATMATIIGVSVPTSWWVVYDMELHYLQRLCMSLLPVGTKGMSEKYCLPFVSMYATGSRSSIVYVKFNASFCFARTSLIDGTMIKCK